MTQKQIDWLINQETRLREKYPLTIFINDDFEQTAAFIQEVTDLVKKTNDNQVVKDYFLQFMKNQEALWRIIAGKGNG